MAKGSKVIKRSLNEVYDASVRALQESGFTITEKKGNTIKATSGISIVSWGEHMEVILSSKPNGTEVKATSEAYQIFDWGKSEENLSKFFTNLKKQLGKE